jgi:hypothetical protein
LRRRRKKSSPRVDVGRYVAPAVPPIAPIEQVVDEGVQLTMWSVRMAIKNRLIVAALRDGEDFNMAALMTAARAEMSARALENDETADRLRVQEGIPAGAAAPGSVRIAQDRPLTIGQVEAEEHRRRPLVHRMLADALREKIDDDAFVAETVDRARRDAWQEVGRELTKRLKPPGFVPDRPADYERMRAGRVKRLIDVDLAKLKRTSRAD